MKMMNDDAQKQAEKLFKAFAKAAKGLPRIDTTQIAKAMTDEIRKALHSNGQLLKLAGQFEKSLEKIRPQIQGFGQPLDLNSWSLSMANHGWYIHWDTEPKDIRTAYDLIESSDISGLNVHMMALEDRYSQSRWKKLARDHSERASAFTEIQEAFKLGLYRSTVLMCLAQADGICQDMYNVEAYKHAGSHLRRQIEDLELKGQLTLFIIAPSLFQHSMVVDAKNWQKKYSKKGGLNRHVAMHGLPGFDFGTNEYAYKAISWLMFIGLSIPMSRN